MLLAQDPDVISILTNNEFTWNKNIDYKDIEEAEVKRMYGNAFFKVKLKGESKKKNILRFSYAAAEVADAATNFVNVVNE